MSVDFSSRLLRSGSSTSSRCRAGLSGRSRRSTSCERRSICRSRRVRPTGFVIGGVLPVALAADWLTSAWDQNAGLALPTPAAAVVEEVAGRWLKELLGLPAHASFAFVTGCQMAHATALLAARHHVLEEVGHDVEQEGLIGAPAITVVAGAKRHGTL